MKKCKMNSELNKERVKHDFTYLHVYFMTKTLFFLEENILIINLALLIRFNQTDV